MSEFLNILKWIKKRDAVSPSAIMESFPLTEEEAKKQLDNLIALGYVENGEDGENEVSLGGLGLVEIHSLSSIIERLIEVQDLSRYAVISYSDEDVYPGFPTGISVFYSNTPDIDFPYIDDFVSFFPEAKRMAAFIKENVESGKVIICQCEYGQSRSAGTAAAILEAYYQEGIQVFSSFECHPNKAIYNKLLKELRGVSVNSELI